MHKRANSHSEGLSAIGRLFAWVGGQKPEFNGSQAQFNGIARETAFANEAPVEILTSGASEDVVAANEQGALEDPLSRRCPLALRAKGAKHLTQAIGGLSSKGCDALGGNPDVRIGSACGTSTTTICVSGTMAAA